MVHREKRTSNCMVSDPCQRHDSTGMELNATMQVGVPCLPLNSSKGRIRYLTFARSQRKNMRQELVGVVLNRRIALLKCRSRM